MSQQTKKMIVFIFICFLVYVFKRAQFKNNKSTLKEVPSVKLLIFSEEQEEGGHSPCHQNPESSLISSLAHLFAQTTTTIRYVVKHFPSFLIFVSFLSVFLV